MADDRRDNSTDEIEITPAMIEAGVTALYGMDRRFCTDEEIVSGIYHEMAINRPNNTRHAVTLGHRRIESAGWLNKDELP